MIDNSGVHPDRSLSPRTLRWIGDECGADVVRVTPLIGGITADMARVTTRSAAGDEADVVLRQWPTCDAEAVAFVEQGSAALLALTGHDVAAPRLIAADPSGAAAGACSTLTTVVPGAVWLTPTDADDWVRRLAGTQARIHAVTPTPTRRSDGWFDADRPLGWIADPGLRAAALALAAAAPTDPDVFVHGDFQHFNVLWRDGRISGVVDWPMAGVGPRGVDVGHCRLNLAVLFSAELAEQYLQHYRRAAGVDVEPGAELRALLNWDRSWQEFIPRQVAGRAPVDVDGMAARVAATVAATVRRAG